MYTKRNNNKKIFILFTIMFILVLALFIYKPARTFIVYKFISTTNIVRSVYDKSVNINQIEKIESEKVFLQSQVSLLRDENKKLLNELGIRAENEDSKKPLLVLSSKSTLYGNLYMKNDKSLNLYEGMYVYGSSNLVVGTISNIYDKYIQVNFLGQKEKFTAEIIDSGELIELTSSGLGLYTGSLPKSSKLETGQTVAMKGYPKAIVGNISQIEEDNTSVNIIWIRSPLNISKMDILYVDIQ
jgi:cell shape-determining protein MreC